MQITTIYFIAFEMQLACQRAAEINKWMHTFVGDTYGAQTANLLLYNFCWFADKKIAFSAPREFNSLALIAFLRRDSCGWSTNRCRSPDRIMIFKLCTPYLLARTYYRKSLRTTCFLIVEKWWSFNAFGYVLKLGIDLLRKENM